MIACLCYDVFFIVCRCFFGGGVSIWAEVLRHIMKSSFPVLNFQNSDLLPSCKESGLLGILAAVVI